MLCGRVRVACALAALAMAGCGAKTSPQDLHTPGVKPQRNPGAGAAIPTPSGGPVTHAEIAVIRGWSGSLRHSHVAAATRYFAVPATVDPDGSGTKLVLKARRQVRRFNRALPCGAKLRRWERAPGHFVIATFRLTNRPGTHCTITGNGLAAVAFLIRRHHIAQWLRVPVPQQPDSDKIA